MQRFESTQIASGDRFTGSSTLSEHASNLLGDRQTVFAGKTNRDSAVSTLSFDDSMYATVEKVGSCARADDACSWRPSENSNSPQSRAWRSQREAQRDKPLDLQDGKYEIKPGDTMNDIAKRYYKDLGIEPSKKEIDSLSKMIADQNKDQYSILKCNPNLIRPGMKLEMPPADRIDDLLSKGGSGKNNGFGSAEGGLMNVPGFQAPWSSFEDLDMDALRNSLRDALPTYPDLPVEEEGGFMNLPFRPGEDPPGRFEKLPFKPFEDPAGIFMTLEDHIDPRSAKGFLNAIKLPELSFT